MLVCMSICLTELAKLIYIQTFGMLHAACCKIVPTFWALFPAMHGNTLTIIREPRRECCKAGHYLSRKLERLSRDYTKFGSAFRCINRFVQHGDLIQIEHCMFCVTVCLPTNGKSVTNLFSVILKP